MPLCEAHDHREITKHLLGHALAHEIGHLLLGTLDHANQGIMRAPWPLRALETQAWDECHFIKEQRKRLRRAMEERDQAIMLDISRTQH